MFRSVGIFLLRCLLYLFVFCRDSIESLLRAARVHVNNPISSIKPRFQRRAYYSSGPGFYIHADSHLKLINFGQISISAFVDGYSRFILGLQVHVNAEPRQTLQLYLDCIQRYGLFRALRTDRGPEFNLVDFAHVYLHKLYFGEEASAEHVLSKGTSTANSRVESLWSRLQALQLAKYLHAFRVLRGLNESFVDMTDAMIRSAFQIAFVPFIAAAVSEFQQWWNGHRIRRSKQSVGTGSLPGRPVMLFMHPPAPARRFIENRSDLSQQCDFLRQQLLGDAPLPAFITCAPNEFQAYERVVEASARSLGFDRKCWSFEQAIESHQHLVNTYLAGLFQSHSAS